MTVCTNGTKENGADGTKENGAHSPACGIAAKRRKVTRGPLESHGTAPHLQYGSYLQQTLKSYAITKVPP